MFAQAWDIIADQEPVEVVIRFAPTVAARVQEARWHPSQQVVGRGRRLARRGGRRSPGTIEVRLWALQWGDDAEVLAPASLREDVAATVRRSAARYEAGG